MTEVFKIYPSNMLCRCLIGMYCLAVITISLFQIALIYKCALVVLVSMHALWCVHAWRKRKILCEFNANKNLWRVSKNGYVWIQVDKIRAIYVTEYLIWINFYTEKRCLISVWVGADSLDAPKYLQLRRSVICPAVLCARSA